MAVSFIVTQKTVKLTFVYSAFQFITNQCMLLSLNKLFKLVIYISLFCLLSRK